MCHGTERCLADAAGIASRCRALGPLHLGADYVSVGLLAVAGTVGAITSLWFTESVWIVLALTVSGVLAVVFSSVH